MSDLANQLRDLVPHIRGSGLDAKGHVRVRAAADALDAVTEALQSLCDRAEAAGLDTSKARHALSKVRQ